MFSSPKSAFVYKWYKIADTCCVVKIKNDIFYRT